MTNSYCFRTIPTLSHLLMPSENRHQGKLSKYEFIGIELCWPKDLQCESEKVLQLQTTSENSCPSCHLINHLNIFLHKVLVLSYLYLAYEYPHLASRQ